MSVFIGFILGIVYANIDRYRNQIIKFISARLKARRDEYESEKV